MATKILFEEFKPMVDFMVHLSQRFNCPKEFAVGFLRPEEPHLYDKLVKVVEEALRHSDLYAEKDGNIFVILPGATKKGVDFIKKALFDFFNGEVLEVYEDYPQDGKTTEELLEKLATDVENKYGYIIKKYFKK